MEILFQNMTKRLSPIFMHRTSRPNNVQDNTTQLLCRWKRGSNLNKMRAAMAGQKKYIEYQTRRFRASLPFGQNPSRQEKESFHP